MSRIFSYLLILILVVIGCRKNDDLLDNETLAGIIADMHIAEIAIKRDGSSDADSLQALFHEKLAEIHKLSPEDLKYQVETLMENPERQSEVYTIVIMKLQEIEKAIKGKKDSQRTLNAKEDEEK